MTDRRAPREPSAPRAATPRATAVVVRHPVVVVAALTAVAAVAAASGDVGWLWFGAASGAAYALAASP